MKIVDKSMLASFHRGVCELCGHRRLTEPHHAVSTRGAGRLDIEVNLVALCRPCHQGVDSAEGRRRCLEVLAKRHKCTVDDIEAAVRFFKRQQKGLRRESLRSIAAGMVQECDLSAKGYLLVCEAVDAMPDQSPEPMPIKKRKESL